MKRDPRLAPGPLDFRCVCQCEEEEEEEVEEEGDLPWQRKAAESLCLSLFKTYERPQAGCGKAEMALS